MPNIATRIPVVYEYISTRFLGDEAVIMNLRSMLTYSLNGTAARIWFFIDGSRSVCEIADSVTAEYDVTRSYCLSRVIELIETLCAEQLVTLTTPND